MKCVAYTRVVQVLQSDISFSVRANVRVFFAPLRTSCKVTPTACNGKKYAPKKEIEVKHRSPREISKKNDSFLRPLRIESERPKVPNITYWLLFGYIAY